MIAVTPEIDESPQYTKAAGEFGSTVKLTCRASGAPKLTFTWTKVCVVTLNFRIRGHPKLP